jgi:hypothetical protein
MIMTVQIGCSGSQFVVQYDVAATSGMCNSSVLGPTVYVPLQLSFEWHC